MWRDITSHDMTLPSHSHASSQTSPLVLEFPLGTSQTPLETNLHNAKPVGIRLA